MEQTENPETNPYTYGLNSFSTKVPMQFNKERIFFSTNGTGTISKIPLQKK